ALRGQGFTDERRVDQCLQVGDAGKAHHRRRPDARPKGGDEGEMGACRLAHEDDFLRVDSVRRCPRREPFQRAYGIVGRGLGPRAVVDVGDQEVPLEVAPADAIAHLLARTVPPSASMKDDHAGSRRRPAPAGPQDIQPVFLVWAIRHVGNRFRPQRQRRHSQAFLDSARTEPSAPHGQATEGNREDSGADHGTTHAGPAGTAHPDDAIPGRDGAPRAIPHGLAGEGGSLPGGMTGTVAHAMDDCGRRMNETTTEREIGPAVGARSPRRAGMVLFRGGRARDDAPGFEVSVQAAARDMRGSTTIRSSTRKRSPLLNASRMTSDMAASRSSALGTGPLTSRVTGDLPHNGVWAVATMGWWPSVGSASRASAIRPWSATDASVRLRRRSDALTAMPRTAMSPMMTSTTTTPPLPMAPVDGAPGDGEPGVCAQESGGRI